MYDQLQFERKWSENFMNEVYANFLTTEEISSMMHNKDIWMTSDEVVERLNRAVELAAKEEEETKE